MRFAETSRKCAGPEIWEISYVVESTDAAGAITFSLDIVDLAGNELTVTTADSGGVEIGILVTPCDFN